MLEKLQLKDEKNLLIQGLPSAIEKQFVRLSFAKNVTPLLKARRIDFALVFAINEKQLNNILNDVLPALQQGGKLWIAFPKKTSKIVTDLNKDSSWSTLAKSQFESVREITLDHVWIAVRYKKATDPDDVFEETIESEETKEKTRATSKVNIDEKEIVLPADLEEELKRNKTALNSFKLLSNTNKTEFIEWIVGAKKDVTKQKRLKDTIDKLVAGKKNPSEK